MKQIGLGLMQYTQDYDETMPGYRQTVVGSQINPYSADASVGPRADEAVFINQMLHPYIKSDQVWADPSHSGAWVNTDKAGYNTAVGDPFQSYGGQNSYAVNNYAFRSNFGTALASLQETAQTVGMVCATYYNAYPRGPAGAPCRLAGESGYPASGSTNPLTGVTDPTRSSYPHYWKHIGNAKLNFSSAASDPSTQAAELAGKARHLETINVLYLDGHAKSMQYTKLITDEGLRTGSTTSLWDPYKQGCV
jgi:prepilin-type processing-associated H-X9-DG protein